MRATNNDQLVNDPDLVVPVRTQNDDLPCPSVQTVADHLQGLDPAWFARTNDISDVDINRAQYFLCNFPYLN